MCAGFKCDAAGERGGEAKSADWKRVFGALVVSHVSALGSNMIALICCVVGYRSCCRKPRILENRRTRESR